MMSPRDDNPKLYNMSHFFSLNIINASKGSNNYILFAIFTAAGVVPCGGPKKSPPYIIHSADYIFLLIL